MGEKTQQSAGTARNTRKKVKIAFTTGSLAIGGAERWILKLVQKLDRRKFECCVIAIKPLQPPDDALLGEFRENNIPVFGLNLRHYKLLFPLGTMRMKRLLSKIKPDVIQTVLLIDRFFAVRAAAALNIPVVSSFRGTEALAGLPKFKRRIYLEHLECSDEIFAVSEHTRDSLPEEIRKSVSVIHNFVDTKHFSPSGPRSFGEKQEFILGTVSRLEKVKNIPALVELFAAVRSRLPFVKKLIIVGDGSERPAIERLISDKGLSEAVVLAGRQNDVRPWYDRMDFFISTSRSEGMPNTMLEAMASSVIPIITRVGGVPEAISEGENGFFLDPDDMTANIQKLEGIFADCVKTPSKFNNIARAARKTIVSKFIPDVIVPQYEEIFLRLAESRESAE